MPIYDIFSDESSTTTGRYMVIGGIILPTESNTAINQLILDKKQALGLLHEISWDSISKSNVDRYIELYNYVYELVNDGKICFKAIIVDKDKYDNKRYVNKINESSFYKMYFQLLYHKFCKQWFNKNNESRFQLFPDEKSSNVSLLNLKIYLNNSLKYNLGIDGIVLNILPQVSKTSPLIQIVDLYIGCMSYYMNGYYLLPNASKNKIKFMENAQNVSKRPNFCSNTVIKERRFEVWNIRFKK